MLADADPRPHADVQEGDYSDNRQVECQLYPSFPHPVADAAATSRLAEAIVQEREEHCRTGRAIVTRVQWREPGKTLTQQEGWPRCGSEPPGPRSPVGQYAWRTTT
jgi:hypothetical protein